MAARTDTTDPFRLLEAEHRAVEDLFQRLRDAEEADQQRRLVNELERSLRVHMKAEEELLYPKLAHTDSEAAEEAEIEHGLGREGIAQLQAFIGMPGFGAVVDMVSAGIQHHVEEEEGEMFPKLRNRLDADMRAQLTAELERRRSDAGLPALDMNAARRRPSSSRRRSSASDGPTKAELMEKAKERGIEGRSSMTKDELVDALASR